MTRSHRLGRLVRRRLEATPTVRQTMKAGLYKIDHRGHKSARTRFFKTEALPASGLAEAGPRYLQV
jgi:hypothetical protein